MALLIAATVLVIASHVVPSKPGLREHLINTFGRLVFYAGYSLLSPVTLGLLIWAYRAASASCSGRWFTSSTLAKPAPWWCSQDSGS